MAKLKTQPNSFSVETFISSIENEIQRGDCRKLAELMSRICKEAPVMWGSSIVGFGTYHYHYASGREGDWFVTGFSPRKKNLTIYIMSGFSEYDDLLARLGKHTTGVSCLYIKSLAGIDLSVLETLIEKSVSYMHEEYGNTRE